MFQYYFTVSGNFFPTLCLHVHVTTSISFSFFRFLPFFYFLLEETGRNTFFFSFFPPSILHGRNLFLPEVSEPCPIPFFGEGNGCFPLAVMSRERIGKQSPKVILVIVEHLKMAEKTLSWLQQLPGQISVKIKICILLGCSSLVLTITKRSNIYSKVIINIST